MNKNSVTQDIRRRYIEDNLECGQIINYTDLTAKDRLEIVLYEVKLRYRATDTASWRSELRAIFGSTAQLAPRGNDLFDLAEKLRISGKEMPEILSICGTEDFMIEDNRKFNRFMRKIEYPGFYSFERPGSHTWEFWDQYIQDVMVFFTTGQLPEK